MGIFSIFNPIATIFYGLIIRIKFSWFSRKKRKKRKTTQLFLEKKLHGKGLEDKIVGRIIDNYLRFGETIFDRKVIHAAFSINRTLDPKKIQQKNNR
ncbi:MAG: DUF1748 domain-containing protein [Candidatus Heimdallarchaeota archaeon]|nr:DUF1748 domain-containing protein [Candidatus Heimdallarchaeota archaeon]MCK4876859.1 DUF1748 domain-containing protein [Candidatus Heimdallarchaeota archaeon]